MDESNCRWIPIQNENILLLDFSGLASQTDVEQICKKPEIEKVALNGGSQEINVSIHEEETVWIQAVGCQFIIDGKKRLLLVLADVTSEKHVDDVIDQKEKEIQRLKQQKDEFMVQVGHDLKTPLTPLLSILPLIRKKTNDPQTKELLDAAIINAEQLKQHVDKILKYAKIKAFGTDYDMKDVALHHVVDEVIHSFSDKLREKHLFTHNEVDDEIEVRADKTRLIELFSQFFSNSIKFTNKKGEITVFAERTGEMVTVSFQDTGSGLNKSQIDKVFNEFYKADDSRHDMTASGLGLTMCKTIVTKHGGRIWAFSMGDGNGVTFYFTLPVSKNKKMELIQ